MRYSDRGTVNGVSGRGAEGESVASVEVVGASSVVVLLAACSGSAVTPHPTSTMAGNGPSKRARLSTLKTTRFEPLSFHSA